MRLTKEVLHEMENEMNLKLESGRRRIAESIAYEAEAKEKYLQHVAELKAANKPLKETETYIKNRKKYTKNTEYMELKQEYETARIGFDTYLASEYSQMNVNFKLGQNGVYNQILDARGNQDKLQAAINGREAFEDLTARKTFKTTIELLATAEKFSDSLSFGHKLFHLGEVWKLHKEKKILREDLMNRFGMDKKGIKNVINFLTSDKEDKYEHTYGFTQKGNKLISEPVVQIDDALGEEKEEKFIFNMRNDKSKYCTEEFSDATWNKSIKNKVQVEVEYESDFNKDTVLFDSNEVNESEDLIPEEVY